MGLLAVSITRSVHAGRRRACTQPRVNANSVPGGPPRRRRKRLHGDRPRRADPRPPGRCAFQNTGPGAVRTGSDFRLSLRSKICIALWFQALIWSEKGAEVHLIIKFPCENIPFFFFFLRRTHSCIRKSFLGPSKHLRD